ncbi:uncharacterized protein YALI1_B28990g [Yarrowia lipolytica]|uniref:Uncharacterized protein n=1 Tax=Yarrowia lipolytica TaxID=4952 RepID=A0A1D8N8Y1_YARLL|nr:hypothetical protein YALI1_B28990g [Yarrowia lipolytica]
MSSSCSLFQVCTLFVVPLQPQITYKCFPCCYYCFYLQNKRPLCHLPMSFRLSNLTSLEIQVEFTVIITCCNVSRRRLIHCRVQYVHTWTYSRCVRKELSKPFIAQDSGVCGMLRYQLNSVWFFNVDWLRSSSSIPQIHPQPTIIHDSRCVDVLHCQLTGDPQGTLFEMPEVP